MRAVQQARDQARLLLGRRGDGLGLDRGALPAPAFTPPGVGAQVYDNTGGANGFITAPEPAALAEAFDRLHGDRAGARRMGEAAFNHVAALGIDWDTVIGKLLA